MPITLNLPPNVSLSSLLSRLDAKELAELESAILILSPPQFQRTNLPFRQWAKTYLPHFFNLPPSKLHADLAERLETLTSLRGQKDNWLAPRGSGKSIWVSGAYPLYGVLEGTERYAILSSDTSGQAETLLATVVSELEKNDEIRAAYPWLKRPWPMNRRNRIELPNGCCIEAYGTGMKLRGRRLRQYRPSLIICDDPQNSMHIISALQRQRSLDWLMKDVANAGDPQTNIIVLGTALHPDAIVMVLQKTAGWRSATYKSIVEWPKRMDLWNEWQAILQDYSRPERDALALAFYQANKGEMDA